MKKLIYSAAAMAFAFFAASCQKEVLEPVVSANTVTYTVQVADAVATKALGDDVTAVNELVYEVYRTAAEETTAFTSADNLLYHKTATITNGVATIELEFVNDQNFTVLFWAQTKDNGVYNVENLTNVTIASPDVANNVNAQAFVGRDFVRDCVSDANGKVTLHRPVSQLNIATTPASLNIEGQTTVGLEGSSVKVTGLATAYNIATLCATGATATEYEYTETVVPTDVLTVNGVDYTYVAMNYVGFAQNEGSNVTVSYVINTTEGNIDNEIVNVPVKPNYRTNIIGNLITSKTEYEITLDKTWGENAPVEVVTTVATLKQAIENIPAGGEGEIVLDGDINLNELFAALTKAATEDVSYLTIPAGKEVVLNLNGYSLTGVDQTQKNFGLIQNNGKLTVKNTATKVSKMSLVAEHNNGWNRYSAVISNNPGAELTVEGNVVIEHLGGTDMAYGIDILTNGGTGAVKATIDGATVTSTYRAVRQFLNSATTNNELTIKTGSTIRGAENNKAVFFHDPSKSANLGKLTIEEGASVSGVYLFVTAGSTEWPVEVSIAASSIAQGYEVVPANVPADLMVANVNGFWTVVEAWVEEGDEVVIKSAEALRMLASKVNAGETFEGKTVKLGADIDLKNVEWTPIGSATQEHGFMGNFDGNGYTIKNLQMTALTPDSDGYVYAGLFGVTEGTETQENYIKNLVIENVTIETAGHIVAAAVAYPYYTTLENITVKGDINIKGGDYTAGVLAYTRRCVNAKNIAIVAKANSVIEGNKTVGGVISDIQMNGGLTANYSNFSASGLTIKGLMHVGGISGIICLQTLDGAIVENVAIVSDDVRKGALVGSLGDDSVINGASVNNVTGAANWVGATYKDGSTCSVTINGVAYKYLENGKIEDANGYEIVANGLGYKDKTYAVSTAEGLVTLAAKGLKAGDKVILTADIDLAGVEFNGLDTFHPENNNVFDGQGHKVSNWTNHSGASDMGFIRNWVGTIKNLTIEKASLKTSGRSAIVGAKVYGNIENCHVIDCTLEDSYWACGLIAGLYNAGNISDCSATNSTVKSNGGTGAIVGVVNETAGTRSFTNCVVTGCTVNNTGAYGEAYCGALVCGMINISNSTVKFVGCEYSDNTKVGSYVGDLYYAAGSNVTVVVE